MSRWEFSFFLFRPVNKEMVKDDEEEEQSNHFVLQCLLNEVSWQTHTHSVQEKEWASAAKECIPLRLTKLKLNQIPLAIQKFARNKKKKRKNNQKNEST